MKVGTKIVPSGVASEGTIVLSLALKFPVFFILFITASSDATPMGKILVRTFILLVVQQQGEVCLLTAVCGLK